MMLTDAFESKVRIIIYQYVKVLDMEFRFWESLWILELKAFVSFNSSGIRQYNDAIDYWIV